MTIAAAVLVVIFLVPVTGFATTISLDPADATVHDILSISAGFDTTTLFLTATFRTSTFDPNPNNFGFVFLLDTDLNVSTGHNFQDPSTGRELGADFTVEFHRAIDPSGIAIVEEAPTGVAGILRGTVPVVFGTDSFALAVPLSLIGNGNGVTNFGLQVGTPFFLDPSAITFTTTDFAYSLESSTPVPASVPEPGNFMFLSTGLLSLLLACRRKPRIVSRTDIKPPDGLPSKFVGLPSKRA
jgi:hypothetical protein